MKIVFLAFAAVFVTAIFGDECDVGWWLNEKPPLKAGDVTFTIITRDNKKPMPLNPNTVKGVNAKETKILVPDWMTNSSRTNLATAYIDKGDYNVITVHAEKYMSLPLNVSVTYTKAIANTITKLIIALHKKAKVRYVNFHLIGLGLGSHIAGLAGQLLREANSQMIARITALEVLRCGFQNSPYEKRLDLSSALAIDVIHTAAGTYGLNESLGDVNFWVNGGTAPQPGCDKGSSKEQDICSKDASYWYFIDSMESYIKVQQCNCDKNSKDSNCKVALFGDNYNIHRKVRGDFCLNYTCSKNKCNIVV